LQSGKIPFERGWILNRDDILRREIIKDIRTFFELDIEKISYQYNINFYEYFKEENYKLKEFFNDNLIYEEKNKLILTEDGKHFANLIGSNFDTFINTKIRFNQGVALKA
jgi:oxygen-independent coproporphyrinogen-3 oxidase